MGGNRRHKPVFGKLKTGGSSGNGKPGKEIKSDSSEDDSDDGNDGGKWKEERESERVAAAAKVAVLQKQVDSLQQELVMKKEYSASSLSSGSNASKCVVALKLTDAHKSHMNRSGTHMDGAGLGSYLMQTSMCTIQLHSQRC